MPGVKLPANMTEFGRTPFFTAAEFQEIGYAMVIRPVSSLRAANKAQEELYAAIRRDGSTQAMLDRMQTRAELDDVIGLADDEERRRAPASRHRRAYKNLLFLKKKKQKDFYHLDDVVDLASEPK